MNLYQGESPRAKPTVASLRISEGEMCAYVGNDWLLYADHEAHYQHSITMAPVLMLAQPGKTLTIVPDGALAAVVSNAILVGPTEASQSHPIQSGGIFLYFDPVRPAAMALKNLAVKDPSHHQAWRLPESVHWSGEWFNNLIFGDVEQDRLVAWVSTIKLALLSESQVRNQLDWRLQKIAHAIHANPSGRISTEKLAADVGWSGAHLRQYFRDHVGLTMSKYQIWCRFFLLAHQVANELTKGANATATDRLHNAGFYDASHGFKMVRKYLGLSPEQTKILSK